MILYLVLVNAVSGTPSNVFCLANSIMKSDFALHEEDRFYRMPGIAVRYAFVCSSCTFITWWWLFTIDLCLT